MLHNVRNYRKKNPLSATIWRRREDQHWRGWKSNLNRNNFWWQIINLAVLTQGHFRLLAQNQLQEVNGILIYQHYDQKSDYMVKLTVNSMFAPGWYKTKRLLICGPVVSPSSGDLTASDVFPHLSQWSKGE